MPPPAYPALFQVNTRVRLSELSAAHGRKATLDDISDAELDRLAADGFDLVWFLGVWQTGEGGRLILAHNELLYPYHKWFLRGLQDAKEKPEGLLESIRQLNAAPTIGNVETLYEKVKAFRPWIEGDFSWPTRFMYDSELNWMDGRTPVDDL